MAKKKKAEDSELLKEIKKLSARIDSLEQEREEKSELEMLKEKMAKLEKEKEEQAQSVTLIKSDLIDIEPLKKTEAEQTQPPENQVIKRFRCGKCETPIEKTMEKCPNCGEPLDWGDIREAEE